MNDQIPSNGTLPFYRKNPGLFISISISIFLILALGLSELTLRSLGNEAGKYASLPEEYKLDSIAFYSSYIADTHGITKLSQSAGEWISDDLQSGNQHTAYPDKIGDIAWPLLSSFGDPILQDSIGEFSRYINALRQKSADSLTDLENAYLQYAFSPINQAGFRSIPFRSFISDKGKVLLLGDSFTYGENSGKLYSSFADILASMGYAVYNSGIPSTDPAQYLQVLETYFPEIEPDYVIVNFFAGNDRMIYEREIIPFQPLFYPTNLGQIDAWINGAYIESEEEILRLFRASEWIPGADAGFVEQVLSRSVIGTRLWIVLERIGIFDNPLDRIHDSLADRGAAFKREPYVSDLYIRTIRDFCIEKGSKPIILVIPELPHINKSIAGVYPGMMEEIEYHTPSNWDNNHFDEDWHFSPEGHHKWAHFIDSLISHVNKINPR